MFMIIAIKIMCLGCRVLLQWFSVGDLCELHSKTARVLERDLNSRI